MLQAAVVYDYGVLFRAKPATFTGGAYTMHYVDRFLVYARRWQDTVSQAPLIAVLASHGQLNSGGNENGW